MSNPPQFTGSIWFLALVSLLVSLGSQVLIEALMPMAAFDWLFDEASHQGPVVLVAGESFWREDSIIRAVAFGIGALFACLLAKSHSLRLLVGVLAVSLAATAFAQFPTATSYWQFAIWGCSAPAGALLVGAVFRAFSRNA